MIAEMVNVYITMENHDVEWIVHSYPLVNIQQTLKNHHVYWDNSLFLWSIFNRELLNYQRGFKIGL